MKQVKYVRDSEGWLEITIRSIPDSEIKWCQYCGEPFFGGRSDRRFCSDICRHNNHYHTSRKHKLARQAKPEESGK